MNTKIWRVVQILWAQALKYAIVGFHFHEYSFSKSKVVHRKGKASRCCAKFSPIVNFFCESTDRSLMLWIWQTNPHNNQGMPYCFNNKKKIVKKTALYTHYSLTLPWSSSFLKLLHCNLSGLWVSSELHTKNPSIRFW